MSGRWPVRRLFCAGSTCITGLGNFGIHFRQIGNLIDRKTPTLGDLLSIPSECSSTTSASSSSAGGDSSTLSTFHPDVTWEAASSTTGEEGVLRTCDGVSKVASFVGFVSRRSWGHCASCKVRAHYGSHGAGRCQLPRPHCYHHGDSSDHPLHFCLCFTSFSSLRRKA